MSDKPARTEPADTRGQRLRERLCTEWIAGAEEEWRRRIGRPMAAAELERVLRRYPGDVWALRSRPVVAILAYSQPASFDGPTGVLPCPAGIWREIVGGA